MSLNPLSPLRNLDSREEIGREERNTADGKGLFPKGVKAERQLVDLTQELGMRGRGGGRGGRGMATGNSNGMRTIPGREPHVGTSCP